MSKEVAPRVGGVVEARLNSSGNDIFAGMRTLFRNSFYLLCLMLGAYQFAIAGDIPRHGNASDASTRTPQVFMDSNAWSRYGAEQADTANNPP